MSADHTDRHAREDNRNEAALLRRLVRHEEEVRRRERAREWRRLQPVIPNPNPVEDLPDFPGCYW